MPAGPFLLAKNKKRRFIGLAKNKSATKKRGRNGRNRRAFSE